MQMIGFLLLECIPFNFASTPVLLLVVQYFFTVNKWI
jgi:hypothetical protein